MGDRQNETQGDEKMSEFALVALIAIIYEGLLGNL